MLPFGQTVYQKKLGLGLDPNPNQKQKSIWLKFNSIHYGIEINKCLQFLGPFFGSKNVWLFLKLLKKIFLKFFRPKNFLCVKF